MLYASKLLRIVREHWGIENVLHWTPTSFPTRIRREPKDHAPANLAVLRRLALTCSRSSDTKTSLRGKLKRALGRQFPRRYALEHAIALP
jgi:hypothetical protein